MSNDRRPSWVPSGWRYTEEDGRIQPAKMSSASTTCHIFPWYSREGKRISYPVGSSQKPQILQKLNVTPANYMPRLRRAPPRIEHDYLYIKPRRLTDEEIYERINWEHPFVPIIPKNPGHSIQNLLNLTADQLREKQQKAIAEEAEKKKKRQNEFEKLNAPRYIKLGYLLCSITPDELGILSDENIAKIDKKLAISPEKYVSNLGKFCKGLTNFLGDAAGGTVFSDGATFASSLSQVYRKAFSEIDYRLEQEEFRKEIKVRREEQRERTKQKKLEERYIAVGRAICSLTPDDFFNLSTSSEFQESPEDVAKKPKKKAIRAEDDPEVIAYRGEELLENIFDFCDYVGFLMEKQARWTIFRSPAEFTHIFCNVAEKSVRDRRRRKSQKMRVK